MKRLGLIALGLIGLGGVSTALRIKRLQKDLDSLGSEFVRWLRDVTPDLVKDVEARAALNQLGNSRPETLEAFHACDIDQDGRHALVDNAFEAFRYEQGHDVLTAFQSAYLVHGPTEALRQLNNRSKTANITPEVSIGSTPPNS